MRMPGDGGCLAGWRWARVCEGYEVGGMHPGRHPADIRADIRAGIRGASAAACGLILRHYAAGEWLGYRRAFSGRKRARIA
jgi:hypothetical protein